MSSNAKAIKVAYDATAYRDCAPLMELLSDDVQWATTGPGPVGGRLGLNHLPSKCQSVSQLRMGRSKRTPSSANSLPSASIDAKDAIWFASATVSQKLTLCIALFVRSMPT
jgi:hypothetical protein